MPGEETIIDFSQFPHPDSFEFEHISFEEYGVYDMCTIYILEATAHPSRQWFLSNSFCGSPTNAGWCDGKIELIRYDLPAQIEWRCKKCDRRGKIINFEETEWDIRNLSEEEQQQRIVSHVNATDTMEAIENLSEEELQDFLGFLDQNLENMGVDIRDDSGGLTSVQLSQLLDSNWESSESKVRLDNSLPLEKLESSLFLHNGRAFLQYLKQEGELPCTQRGNLTRKNVAGLIDRCWWPDRYIEEIKEANKVINETDVWLLHTIRVLLELAGLIQFRNNAFHLTKKRIKLLDDDNAGKLYHRLFYTYFREMNMGYIVNNEELWGLQDTISYTLYRLDLLDDEWKTIEDTTAEILSPLVRDQLEMEGMTDFVVYSYLIKPLVFFGLLETKFSDKQSDSSYFTPDEFRKQPLFDEFLTFDVEEKHNIEETQIPDNVIPLNNASANNRKMNSAQNGNLAIYQLKITLDDISPPIWRRVLVRSDTSLPDLHKIIQSSMGWTNSHLHQFIKNRQFYSIPFDDGWEEDRIIDYRNFQINDLLQEEKQIITYEYDFGDSWRHSITLEKILPVDTDKHYPICIKGKRHCPPDDCGGSWGYQQMLEILDDPGHAEHEMWSSWINGFYVDGFNPEHFDKQWVNELLHSKNYGVVEL